MLSQVIIEKLRKNTSFEQGQMTSNGENFSGAELGYEDIAAAVGCLDIEAINKALTTDKNSEGYQEIYEDAKNHFLAMLTEYPPGAQENWLLYINNIERALSHKKDAKNEKYYEDARVRLGYVNSMVLRFILDNVEEFIDNVQIRGLVSDFLDNFKKGYFLLSAFDIKEHDDTHTGSVAPNRTLESVKEIQRVLNLPVKNHSSVMKLILAIVGVIFSPFAPRPDNNAKHNDDSESSPKATLAQRFIRAAKALASGADTDNAGASSIPLHSYSNIEALTANSLVHRYAVRSAPASNPEWFISGIDRDSIAAKAGLDTHDTIEEINGKPVEARTQEALDAIFQLAKSEGRPLELKISRHNHDTGEDIEMWVQLPPAVDKDYGFRVVDANAPIRTNKPY